MKPVVVNLTAVIASAMYWQLSIPENTALKVNVTDFNVSLTPCEKVNGYYADSICGYVKTKHDDKEVKLDFTVVYRDDGIVLITITQDIVVEQDMFTLKPEKQAYVDFNNRKVFYKWEEKYKAKIDNVFGVIIDSKNNEISFERVAQDILNVILDKV